MCSDVLVVNGMSEVLSLSHKVNAFSSLQAKLLRLIKLIVIVKDLQRIVNVSPIKLINVENYNANNQQYEITTSHYEQQIVLQFLTKRGPFTTRKRIVIKLIGTLEGRETNELLLTQERIAYFELKESQDNFKAKTNFQSLAEMIEVLPSARTKFLTDFAAELDILMIKETRFFMTNDLTKAICYNIRKMGYRVSEPQNGEMYVVVN
jgi:hypothetical protein